MTFFVCGNIAVIRQNCKIARSQNPGGTDKTFALCVCVCVLPFRCMVGIPSVNIKGEF